MPLSKQARANLISEAHNPDDPTGLRYALCCDNCRHFAAVTDEPDPIETRIGECSVLGCDVSAFMVCHSFDLSDALARNVVVFRESRLKPRPNR